MSDIDTKSIKRVEAAEITGAMLAKAFRWMASEAAKMGAATMNSEIGFSVDDEEADGDFVPSIVLRIKRIV